MLVSAHFNLTELTNSSQAIRLGKVIVPSETELASLVALAVNVLEPARTLCGIIHISSGLRPEWLNIAIGGASGSQHMLGEAADCEPKQMSVWEMAQIVAASQIPFDQLIYEFGAWVHLSYGSRNRRQVLTAQHQGEGKPTLYLPGLVR